MVGLFTTNKRKILQCAIVSDVTFRILFPPSKQSLWRRLSFTAPGADSLRFQRVPILVAPEISARA